MRAPGKHALVFVFITVLIDTIGFGIILPVMPRLIVTLTGDTLSRATLLAGFLLTTFAALQFVCGPIMGNLSDRFGRRPVLVASLAAFSFDYALMGFSPTIGWLFLGRAVAGIAGAVYSPALAYIADITPPEKRAQSFGMMGAAFGLGFILGPALGGLLGQFGPRAPFFAAAALAAANFVYGLFALPETLTAERRRKFEWKRANPLGTLMALKRYPGVLAIAGGVFVWQLGYQVYPATWAFFAKIRFGLSELGIGETLAFTGLVMAFVQGYLTGKIVPKIGEYRAALIAMVTGCINFIAFSLITQVWMVYVIMTIGAAQALAYPSMNAIMSKQVPPNEQGELQGGVSSMMSLSTIFGPLIMTQALGRFTSPGAPFYFPGAAFALAAVLAFISLLIVLRAARGAGAVASPLPSQGAAS